MKERRPPAKPDKTVPADHEEAVRMGEALAQVNSHAADAIRAQSRTGMSDRDLLVKIAEARQATTSHRMQDELRLTRLQKAALEEILRKAALEVPVRPPTHARFAIFLLPKSYQHIIFGDLEELYPIWSKECGPSKAAFLYWWQLAISTAQIAWPRTRKLRYVTTFVCLLARALSSVHFAALADILRHLR